MRTSLKRIGVFAGAFLALVVLAAVAIYLAAGARLSKIYDVRAEPVAIPTDTASIERGRQLVIVGRCTACHGDSLGGQALVDEPSIGRIYASNLTTGRGGVGRTYSDADWVRAIRHGIRPDGRSLVVTPAQYYYFLSDADLGAIIAYIKSVPPVDNELPAPSIRLLGRGFLMLYNPPEWLPAEKINHAGPRPPPPTRGATTAYGQYLVAMSTCLVCHAPADLSAAPGGKLATWSEADFISTIRSGRTPNGSYLDNDTMPWLSTSYLSEDDLRAMWLYLRTLPPDSSPR